MQDLATPSKRELIIWNQIDGKLYKRLTYIFDLYWENLSTEEERKSFSSKGWVVNKIVRSCFCNSIGEMIDKEVEHRAKKLAEEKGTDYGTLDNMLLLYPVEMQAKVDSIIERLFALQKNWLQYRAPKWINVVDSLQKYATTKCQLRSGDYSYVAEMIENEFIQSALRILIEYGIPISAIQKIQLVMKIHGIRVDKLTEDRAIELMRAHQEDFSEYLSEYERNILANAL